MGALKIGACVKWVDLHPEIDPLTGAVDHDERRFGFSAADEAAVEIALRLAESNGGELTIACAGPTAAEAALRELAAVGASRVVRVEVDDDAPSEVVGTSLAAALDGVELVVCGDHSLDRGSGSVPGFLAHASGAASALGLVALTVDVSGTGPLEAVRRLDGGRRERLEITTPAVVSVEGSVARLRRAALHDVLRSRAMPVELVRPATSVVEVIDLDDAEALRPRPRVWPAPEGQSALDRIVTLTGALIERTPPRRIEATSAEAADAIVEQLRTWGYLE